MNMKKYIMNISLIVTISILFTQNLDLFTQKITLENSLRDKIYSELERVLNKNKNRFVVVVNLELGRYGDLISQNQNNNKGNQNARGMEYLPGVPLSGSKGITQSSTAPQRRIGANDYIISEIDIAIYIEQSLATGSNEKMIESFLLGDYFGTIRLLKQQENGAWYLAHEYKQEKLIWNFGFDKKTKKIFIAPNNLGWITICILDNGQNIHNKISLYQKNICQIIL